MGGHMCTHGCLNVDVWQNPQHCKSNYHSIKINNFFLKSVADSGACFTLTQPHPGPLRIYREIVVHDTTVTSHWPELDPRTTPMQRGWVVQILSRTLLFSRRLAFI